VTKKRTWWNW